jgi:hypothetical protein
MVVLFASKDCKIFFFRLSRSSFFFTAPSGVSSAGDTGDDLVIMDPKHRQRQITNIGMRKNRTIPLVGPGGACDVEIPGWPLGPVNIIRLLSSSTSTVCGLPNVIVPF